VDRRTPPRTPAPGPSPTAWSLTIVAAVLVMAPVILVFFFAQKAFVEGVTLTGVKG
jgi:multiple sugar transport system permease protein